jgi:2'-5' RNA ligase
MRIFFALFPPLDTYGRFFADVFKYLDKEKRNLDFMPLEQIHLNIKFLGANVSENSLAYILQTLREFEGQYTKPEVKIKKLQFGFKHQINPNYIVADIYESDSLVSLSEEIHKLRYNPLERKACKYFSYLISQKKEAQNS